MKSWKIRTHLFLLIGTLLSSLLLVGLLGLHGLQSTVRGLETVYLDRVVPLRDLKLIADLYAVNIVDATHKANSGSLSSSAAQALIAQARNDIGKTWQAYLATQLIAEEQRLIAEIKPLMAATEAPLRENLPISPAGMRVPSGKISSQLPCCRRSRPTLATCLSACLGLLRSMPIGLSSLNAQP